MGRFCCLSDSHGEGHDSNCINYLHTAKQIPTSGYGSLFEKFMNEYKELMYEIQTFAMKMPLKTLQMACEVSMNALVVLQDQFKKRFPTEFDAWNKQFED